MKIVLHAGIHRTGTTAIQQAASQNRTQLQENGVFYPKGCNLYPSQHSGMAFDLKSGRIDKVIDRISEVETEAKEANCDLIFLSGEEFCDVSKEILAEFSARCRIPIEVFLIFRNYSDWFASQIRYQSNFVSGFAFYDALNKVHKINYSIVLENYCSAFGKDSLNAIHFADIKGNLVTDAFSLMLNLAGLKTNNYPQTNVSLPFGAASVASFFTESFDQVQRAKLIRRVSARTKNLDLSLLNVVDRNLKASITPPAGCFDHPLLAEFKEDLARVPEVIPHSEKKRSESADYMRVLLRTIEELQEERELEFADD